MIWDPHPLSSILLVHVLRVNPTRAHLREKPLAKFSLIFSLLKGRPMWHRSKWQIIFDRAQKACWNKLTTHALSLYHCITIQSEPATLILTDTNSQPNLVCPLTLVEYTATQISRGPVHTRDWEPLTSSTIQALPLVEKAEPVRVCFTLLRTLTTVSLF